MIEVDGQPHSWRENMTVSDLLAELPDSYPYAVIRLNDKTVTKPYFEITRIPEGARIRLIPMIAGG